MTEEQSKKPLTLSDILKLSESLQVKEVDLGRAGKEGLTYVRELRQGEREAAQRLSGRIEIKNGSQFIDTRSIPQDAARQILKMGWVTDPTGTTSFWSELVKQYTDKEGDIARRKAEQRADEFLQQLPGAVVSLLVEEIREISRLGDNDAAEEYEEEKKES